MDHTYEINSNEITLEDIARIWEDEKGQIQLSAKSIRKIEECRHFLEEKMKVKGSTFYGINTGFGSLCDIRISQDEIEQLQYNLVVSHACGTGDTVPIPVVKLMLLLKIRNMSFGYSGVRLFLVEKLIELYNKQLYPQVFQLGSLGASGDLAPLAHLSLPLLGLGKIWDKTEYKAASELLKKHKIKPITLSSKEGLALLNGTQFSLAYGIYSIIQSEKIYTLCNYIASLSLDAFDCDLSPFDEDIHRIRPHKGQIHAAASVREYLKDSEIANNIKSNVQDPYSFRCIPQVHGASYQVILHAREVLETELNSVTDNPNIFSDKDKILSGGNFHAQPLALVLDYLSLAIAELGSIMERRIYLMLSGKRGLPTFLVSRPGINSGMMILQYTAASIVSQNKQLCTPASIDSIPSSNGQEDHVSMAANAATKLYRIVENTKRLLAIELLVGAQALHFRSSGASGSAIQKLVRKLREFVPVLEEDRLLHDDMQKAERFIDSLIEEIPFA